MSDLRVSLIQTTLYWEDKQANLDMLQQKIDSIEGKPHLIVLPEMFSTGFSMSKDLLAEPMDGSTIHWMRKMSAAKGAILSGSLIIRKEDDEGPHFFNRMIWMLPDGQIGYYDKRHLFAFGNEHHHFSPGNKRLIASVNGWKINLQICYDLRFPVWMRQTRTDTNTSAPEFDVLVFVANWPASRNLAWRVLLQARAIENQCYVIGVNRTGTDGNGLLYQGDSMIVAPSGDLIEKLGDEENIISHTLSRNELTEFRKKFPFLQDGDQFLIQP